MTVLLAFVLVCRDARTPPVHLVRTFTLAKLTRAEASVLMYRIVLNSPEERDGRFLLYECKSEDGTARTVWLYRGQDVEDEMTVEATLQVLYHPRTVGDMGTVFPAFTEYRLMKAVRRK